MTQQEITRNNILIAQFMGITLKAGGVSIWDDPNLEYFRRTEYKRDGICKQCHNDVTHGHDIRCYVLDTEKLNYHSDWNELMRVVEKIESFNEAKDEYYTDFTFTVTNFVQNWTANFIDRYNTEIVTAEGETRIQAAYQAVIEFIQWHNKNQ